MFDKEYVGSFFLNLFFLLLMAMDALVIWNLIESLMGKNAIVTVSATIVFIAGIDFLPIYGLTPALSRITKGVVIKNQRGYNMNTTVITLSIAVFITMVVLYFSMSVNYPDRFYQNDPVLLGNVISQIVSGAGKEDMAITEEVIQRAKLVSKIAGLLPLITTTISCFFNYLNIGNKCIRDEIEALEIRRSNYRERLRKCDIIDVLLHNFTGSIDLIGDFAQNYINVSGTINSEAISIEDQKRMAANNNIISLGKSKIEEFRQRGNQQFDKRMNNENSRVEMKRRKDVWNNFVTLTVQELDKTLKP